MDLLQPVHILDPSVTFRPEKSEEFFRNYTSNNVYHERVRNTYYEMHSRQTLSYAKQRLEYWTKFDHGERTMMEALDVLNSVVDESDPDMFHGKYTMDKVDGKKVDVKNNVVDP
ncbi:Inositol oxygenase [Lamellibrachia satsuma]|nr:Inositol oxygenase [Lamellibrachia satsuma]